MSSRITTNSFLLSGDLDALGLASGIVCLAEPNSRWAGLFQAEADRVKAGLGPALLGLEHYGSTSVPGIKAKPILDILAGVETFAEGLGLAAPLAALGYDYAGPDIVPGHHLFGKGAVRTHLLHVVEYQSVIWNEGLQFRDALRADPALARSYEALKVHLSRQHAESRAEYTAAKTVFIQSVLNRH